MRMGNFFSIPNILSLVRVYLSVPIGVILLKYSIEEYYRIALILLIVAYFSDFLDGFIARRYNLVSEWGRVLDPLGDKVLSAVVSIAFLINGFVSVLFVVVIILRDLLISFFFTVRNESFKAVPESLLLGKFATTFLGIFFILYLFFVSFKLPSLEIALFMKKFEDFVILIFIVSGLHYLYVRVIKSHD